MNSVYYPNNERGGGDYGWLRTRYSFSFNDWYDETKMGFGALRVLNDDVILAAKGFGTHGHKDMEIITVVMRGAVSHEDNMGNKYIVHEGDVQVMSAGTGVRHSEQNSSESESLELFQLWIEPKEESIAPRYNQKNFNFQSVKNNLIELVGKETLPINQDAYIYYGAFDAGITYDYHLKDPKNGVYIFVIKGSAVIDTQELNRRDALGIWNTTVIEIHAESKETTFLLIEVPMN